MGHNVIRVWVTLMFVLVDSEHPRTDDDDVKQPRNCGELLGTDAEVRVGKLQGSGLENNWGSLWAECLEQSQGYVNIRNL